MRKVLLISLLLLLPSGLWAQAGLKVSSITGPVEWRSASSKPFTTVATAQTVQVGDEVRTGPGGQLILEVPDGSYMVVSENSKLTIEDFWSGNLRSIMNLMMGQARFYIKKLGGSPNPYSVRTPTALIAVRGTIFDVIVDATQNSEVQCRDGQVKVENIAGSEVVLDPGFKTLVRRGESPLMPIRIEDEFNRTRIAIIHQKSSPNTDANGAPVIDILGHDNDRGNRISNPQNGSNSTTIDNTQRAKPNLTYPQ